MVRKGSWVQSPPWAPFSKLKKLYRTTRDRKVAGVCSGLSEYADIDVNVIRIIALVLIVTSGFVPGVLIYFLIALLVPVKGKENA
jgi:phage shock protein C